MTVVEYPEALVPLIDRLRFRFWHKGREFGITTDEDLVREFEALEVRSFPYKRAHDSSHLEYEVALPLVEEENAE